MLFNEKRTLKNSLLWEVEQYLDFRKKSYSERSSSIEPKVETLTRLIDFYIQTNDFYKYTVIYSSSDNDNINDFDSWLKENCKCPYVIYWFNRTVSFNNEDDAIHFKLRFGKAQ
jgi:hypothetical protein